jgi:hypothetical protein
MMAHFAKVENGTVVDLIVVGNDDCGGGDFPHSEPVGQAFIAALSAGDRRLKGTWLQTSYNDNFRGRLGQIGFGFDPDTGEHGEFIEPVGFFPPDPEPVTLPSASIDELEDIAHAGDETDI